MDAVIKVLFPLCSLNMDLLIYWQFPIIITRSNNIYGPRQYTEKVQNPECRHTLIESAGGTASNNMT